MNQQSTFARILLSAVCTLLIFSSLAVAQGKRRPANRPGNNPPEMRTTDQNANAERKDILKGMSSGRSAQPSAKKKSNKKK